MLSSVGTREKEVLRGAEREGSTCAETRRMGRNRPLHLDMTQQYDQLKSVPGTFCLGFFWPLILDADGAFLPGPGWVPCHLLTTSPVILWALRLENPYITGECPVSDAGSHFCCRKWVQKENDNLQGVTPTQVSLKQSQKELNVIGAVLHKLPFKGFLCHLSNYERLL